MVLVSIDPFAVRKILLLAVALLGLSSALCFADPLYLVRHHAPVREQVPAARPVARPLTEETNFDDLCLPGRSFTTGKGRFEDLRVVVISTSLPETGPIFPAEL